MNGTSRLYRSTSEAMLGGVAAGLGNYFKIDATIIRIAMVVLTFITGGAFLLFYLLMWVLIPAPGSTAADASGVIQENLNEMGSKARAFVGGNPNAASGSVSGQANGGNGPSTNGGNGGAYNQAQLPQANASSPARQGNWPLILILIGGFFLLMNFGFFRHGNMGFLWPLLLIGLGAIMLSRRPR